MARKLRYFREQMTKAGFIPSTNLMAQVNIDFDDLEVHTFFLIIRSIWKTTSLEVHLLEE